MTRLSIATTNVPGDLSQKLEQIAAAGFTGIELYEPDLTGHSRSADEVGGLVRSLGLDIEVLQPFHDFEGLSGDARKAAFARLDHKLDVMKALGARTLLAGTSTRLDATSDSAQIVEDFRELADRAERAGCRAALTHVWGTGWLSGR